MTRPRYARLIDLTEATPASAFRRENSPRGIPPVSDRMRAAARQRAEGVPVGELAALYGVSRKAISTWCLRVHEAEADARNLRGGR